MALSWIEVQKVIAEARNRGGMLSNFFQKDGEFDVELVNETSFLFKQEAGFSHLYFFTRSSEELGRDMILSKVIAEVKQKNLHLVVDVLGPDCMREPLENAFKSSGWEVLAVLQRMGRKTPADNPCDMPACGLKVDKASKEDALQVQAWLKEFFDAEQEQLPDESQIEEWSSNGTLLVARKEEHGPIVGFAAFDLSPAQLYLRYWFVHPSARGTGAGGALLRTVFAYGARTKRQYFWVKTDNENAIKRYKHYGFEFEPMKNSVLRLRGAE